MTNPYRLNRRLFPATHALHSDRQPDYRTDDRACQPRQKYGQQGHVAAGQEAGDEESEREAGCNSNQTARRPIGMGGAQQFGHQGGLADEGYDRAGHPEDPGPGSPFSMNVACQELMAQKGCGDANHDSDGERERAHLGRRPPGGPQISLDHSGGDDRQDRECKAAQGDYASPGNGISAGRRRRPRPADQAAAATTGNFPCPRPAWPCAPRASLRSPETCWASWAAASVMLRL